MLQALIVGGVAAAVELVFTAIRPTDSLMQPLLQRLDGVRELLAAYAEGQEPGEHVDQQVRRLAMVGTSGLRRTLQRSKSFAAVTASDSIP